MLVQYYITDSPAGTASFFDEVCDGRAVRVQRGVADRADAEVTLSYQDFKRLILENLSSEALPSRKASGDLDKLRLLVAVHDQPEYRAMRERYLDVVSFPI